MVKVAAMGDNVVDCYPARGLMYPGGNCLNVSVFIRRFGGASAYIGAIGNDGAGEHILTALRDEGVDVVRLRRLDGPTAYCVIGHRDEERFFASFDLGVSMFTPSPEDIAFLGDFDAVHVGQSSGLDAHLQGIAGQAPLSYDFSTRRDPAHRRAIAPLCFLASVSAGDLSPREATAIGDEFLRAGAKWALVTLGKQGAFLSDARDRIHVGSYPVGAVDTLGAGDTFIARTLHGLIEGEAPREVLEAAAIAAARTCEHFGAVGHGAPIDISANLDEVVSFNSPTRR
jgi:fructoselysine 6-kinase